MAKKKKKFSLRSAKKGTWWYKFNKSLGPNVVKVLNGTTIAIVVALIPNAILGAIFKAFPDVEILQDFLHIVVVFQYFTALMAGFLVALQFKCDGIQAASVSGATFIASGAWKYINVEIEDISQYIFQISGIGDIINIMLIAALAVGVCKLVSPKLGSLNLVLLPIIVGLGVGYIGTLTLPYVSMVTTAIGNLVNSFTGLQPFVASILIAASFAIIVTSPISSVAIGMAIGLEGISSAAAGMGVTCAATFLIFASARVNKKGVPIAIALGGMKMMMKNFLTHPIIAIPLALTSAISVISVPIFNMGGTAATAGFGAVGLVSPLAALNSSDIGIIGMIVFWIVIPLIAGFLVNWICCDLLHMYDKKIFKFDSGA